MMIHRYEIPLSPPSAIPEGRVVHTAKSRYRSGHLEVWVEVSGFPDPRLVRVFATGEPVTPGAVHLGTYTDGPFVWHLYEVSS